MIILSLFFYKHLFIFMRTDVYILFWLCYTIGMKTSTNVKIKDLYDYIRSFQQENGFPPTVREIQSRFSIKSTASVAYYLKQLEAENLIHRSKQKKRCIEVVGESKVNQVPLLGEIAAGAPILAVENIDSYFPLPEGFFGAGSELFMLQVRGNSMIEIGINNGDYVIIRKQSTADNGEIAAVLIDNDVTLKRFFKEKDHYRLHPENRDMEDIITKNAEILGILVGMMRRY